MTDIRIEWLTDSFDCDQAGCSGDWAVGARVYFDGKLAVNLTPVASCFGGTNYETEEVFGCILAKLGHNVSEVQLHD